MPDSVALEMTTAVLEEAGMLADMESDSNRTHTTAETLHSRFTEGTVEIDGSAEFPGIRGGALLPKEDHTENVPEVNLLDYDFFMTILYCQLGILTDRKDYGSL